MSSKLDKEELDIVSSVDTGLQEKSSESVRDGGRTPIHASPKSRRNDGNSPSVSAKSPVPNLKPRPSRWADEEEDDMFIPIRAAYGGAVKSAAKSPQVSRVEKAKEQAREPERSSRGYKAANPGRGYKAPESIRHVPPESTHPSRGYRASVSNVVKPPIRSSKPESVETSRASLEEIAHMKETMVKKAEARKKEKMEEEARLEAERKARCLAKLQEIEARKKSQNRMPDVSQESKKPDRDVSQEGKKPDRDVSQESKKNRSRETIQEGTKSRDVSQESKSISQKFAAPKKITLLGGQKKESNRAAYNAKRLEIGQRRGYEVLAPSHLSAQAVEFVPWQPPPYYQPYWY